MVEIVEHAYGPDIPALLSTAGLVEYALRDAANDRRTFRNRLFVRGG